MKKMASAPSQVKNIRRFNGWKRWTHFKKNEDGTASIEFVLVAIPFLIIIFAILEFSFMFLGERIIHVAIHDASRMLKTGQIQTLSLTNEDDEDDEELFRKIVCNETLLRLFDCDNLHIDVREVPLLGAPPPTTFEDDGTIDTSSFVYDPGGPSALNLIQFYYEWPLFVNWAGFGVTAWAGNENALLGTTRAYMNEPF